MRIIKIEETESTNTWIARNAAIKSGVEPPCLVYAVSQTAGRGQRGNSWEAEPGKNLTASAVFIPEGVMASGQFAVSEAVALAVVDFLEALGVEARVKWPNDIYVGDRKICGILIENSLLGRIISRAIAGIGININQTEFLSDAPNPVSVSQLTGKTYDIADLARMLAECLSSRLCHLASSGKLHEEFMSKLWRGDGGSYPFLDHRTGKRINASIESVAPDGMLTLLLAEDERRTYAFKEIEFLI